MPHNIISQEVTFSTYSNLFLAFIENQSFRPMSKIKYETGPPFAEFYDYFCDKKLFLSDKRC